ncbi:bifunctional [glutamine synthetase] adenylyltransferase/[glutamine synthetase]-adenylyl-L-tyrosine phosphorylase [Roseomonas sp. SSH11]|uniref:Bifunctional glutamine synthetase adenylyltransferase/adenylyl-removing enzyme n=1 Tax=Pararoseomonas baculiformis TaxID=2820812 RepID=A0ABS4AJ09_9PROT|nr:bifunctional [glutamine synthetase] adenylyltransferase/[glutamine synthetase]-adenylyl-L-tyrosine phosphorylase [Pararoseomonas baculiformis]MBP0446214.1 bifunctional [glutamine synthetase] adenylyltransferase/[glutamine synthetase]-adenylyl-L-tyrosine phosphorylase [Pararoseomonas baculiformis]
MPDAEPPRRSPPAPYDAAAASRLAEDFAAKGAAEAAFAEAPAGAALLAALGGHSPFLADLALREATTLLRFAERGADAAFAAALDPLGRADPAASFAQLGAALRLAKRQAALIIAAADLSGEWALDQVTGALSSLADTCIDLACVHLLRESAGRGEIHMPNAAKRDPRGAGKGSGLVILGMGKLGGRELNYSSDVDLMVLFDPAAAIDPDRAQAIFVRLARDLVRLLEERTAEGYVFRTDLRLRPDPAATPLAVSIPAAISYYESFGQNWERAAMLKARPVAGDRALGEGFLAEIRPFVWRRHLDFAMIADIHSIKRQIHAVHGTKRGASAEIPHLDKLAGHDVKLGRGGIREIEFTAQVAQLIWGGREPALRDPTTLGALVALAAAGRMDRRAAADLADAYVFLRDVEHRLQMVADRQTHRLPEDPEGLARIASFMGFSDPDSFASTLSAHLRRVASQYSRQFESAPPLSLAGGDGFEGGNLVFTGPENDAATLETLKTMGYGNPAAASGMVRAWHHGHRRATRTERARELLTALMPSLLAAFARQREPDLALSRFDQLLERLPAGVQVLSLFHRNPVLLDRVAGVLGAAPALADHLARDPGALEGLLAGGSGMAAASLPALVGAARHYEEALESVRRMVTEGKFEVDVAALEGKLDVDAAGIARSELADAAITCLLPQVSKDFATRHGKIPGGAMAVVAMGKLGGREMLPGSDLDLVLIYDHAEDATESDGPKPLPVPTYFSRLAHQFVAALTAPGAEGKPYEVDMRLRPSGNKGPVAASIAAFERYNGPKENGGQAWTWERMALTRARPVAGPPALRKRIAECCRQALAIHAGPQAIEDARAMRIRMLRDLPPDGPWDVKAIPGGLVEVEFIAQALQCAHAAEHPRIVAPTTRDALANLARAGLMQEAEAARLIRAERFWRSLQSLLRLTVGRMRAEELPPASAHALLHGLAPACGSPPVDLPALQGQMQEIAAGVRDSFERHLGPLPVRGAA